MTTQFPRAPGYGNQEMLTRKCKSEERSQWMTAKVVKEHHAKRFINRLDVLGFEFRVQRENHDVRILVPGEQLNEVLEWLADLSDPVTNRTHTAASSLMLFGIPAGMLVGALFSKIVGFDGSVATFLSAFGGLIALVFVVVSMSRR